MDHGEVGRVPFLAMELIRGEDLKAIVERGGTLSRERFIQGLEPVAQALDAWSAKIGEPIVVFTPAVKKMSLRPIGMPCSGPR